MVPTWATWASTLRDLPRTADCCLGTERLSYLAFCIGFFGSRLGGCWGVFWIFDDFC